MLNSEGMSGKDGNGAGWGRRMEFSSLSRMILSCPILALHDGKKFLTPSLSLSASWSPISPCKTLLFVNFSYN